MSNKIEYRIHRVRDSKEKIYTKKNLIFDLPMRGLICGKSYLAGKTNFITNLLLKPEFYLKDFDGEYMYIISPSASNDNKIKAIIKNKDIPSSNIFTEYDPENLEMLYEFIQDDYKEKLEDKEKIPNYLVYFDDVSFSGKLKGKQARIIKKFAMNSRHFNCSLLCTSQKLSDIDSGIRENLTFAVLFNMATKRELDLMETTFNHLSSKKQFYDMYLDNTKTKHSFIICNYSNDYNEMYLDKDFKPIDTDKYKKDNKKQLKSKTTN